ncbi:SIS domain-containing protein [Planctomycetota bacterium]|nr:SIS domain-containing protein [Planctomycetota bacterium]
MADLNLSDEIKQQLTESAKLKQALLETQEIEIAKAAQMLIAVLNDRGRVYFCGNGGSFTDAHHIVGELVGRYGYDRAPLPAFVLGAGVASMTAIANDYGYDDVFAREARAVMNAGDILVGLTTSGNSVNVCKALEVAQEKAVHTIVLTGEKQAKVDELADLVIHVPSTSTPRIQECHITIGHILCDLIERTLFPQ